MCIFQNLTIAIAFWLLKRMDDSARARLMVLALSPDVMCIFQNLTIKGPGAIRADFGPMPEINFVVITI